MMPEDGTVIKPEAVAVKGFVKTLSQDEPAQRRQQIYPEEKKG